MSRNIYVGLFFRENVYMRGLDDVIAYINSEFPGNTLILDKYIVPDSTFVLAALNNFLAKYPIGDRITISERTSYLSIITSTLQSLGLDIPSLSMSATSQLVQSMPNCLTYAPFDKYSAMSNFQIFVDYQMKQFKILYEPNTDDDIFYQSYIQYIQIQAGYLGIPVSVDTLEINKNYNLNTRTSIILLCSTDNLKNIYLTPSFFTQIPNECYISMTDLNDDCGNIFQNIPAFVLAPQPLNYTPTTQNIYNCLTNKNSYNYYVYAFYDVLFTLEFISNTTLSLTLQNYVSVNPFQTIVAAWSNASAFDLNIRGSVYGKYDGVFTKDVLIGNDLPLFESVNDGGNFNLPESRSLFRTVGIVPFFNSSIYYVNQDYLKIYNEFEELIIVRFDSSITNYNNKMIQVSEIVKNRFQLSYNEDGYFSTLNKIFYICDSTEIVNQTMSKKPIINILFTTTFPNYPTLSQLNKDLCTNNCLPCPTPIPCPIIPPCPHPSSCPPHPLPCNTYYQTEERSCYQRHQSNCCCRRCKY